MKIDTTQIPEETGKRFGQCIVAGLREYLKQPGAREALDDDLVLMHGDLVFESEVLGRVLACPDSCMTVSSAPLLPCLCT